MIINQAMFAIMISEAAVAFIIALPFGHHMSQYIVQGVSSTLPTAAKSVLASIGNVLVSLILILFGGNVHTVHKFRQTEGTLSDGMRIRLLVAQRDMYISGFTLFMFIMLRLIYRSIEENIRLEKSLAAMKKQASGASEGYKSLMTEHEKLEQQMKKLKDLAASESDEKDGEKLIDKLLEQNSTLETDLEVMEARAKEAQVNLAAIKKQASAQSEVHLTMMEQVEKLKKELETVGGKAVLEATKKTEG